MSLCDCFEKCLFLKGTWVSSTRCNRCFECWICHLQFEAGILWCIRRFMPEQGSSCKWVFSKPKSPVFILCYSNLTSQSLRLYDILQRTEMCPCEWCRGKVNVAILLYIFLEREIQLFSVGWIRNTACSPMPCFLEYCHHVEENRPLVGEGWVAAGPLRGLFLQGHTHAWSEAHRRGSGTRRLYLCCLTSVTPNSTSCRTITLWLSDWERVIKLVQSTEERVFF